MDRESLLRKLQQETAELAEKLAKDDASLRIRKERRIDINVVITRDYDYFLLDSLPSGW